MKAMTDRVSIDAPAERVWSVFTDFTKWPEWTRSVSSVEILDGSGVDVGAVVQIKQPRLSKMNWEVIEVVPGESWKWVSHSPGITTTAGHRLTATSADSTLVEQSIEHRGPMAWLFGRATRNLTRRYLRLEGQGLKARCESADVSPPRLVEP